MKQPLQMLFMQHTKNPEWSLTGNGIGRVQIGHNSLSGLSCPWLYSCSSFNSAARFLQALLCRLRWAFWQSTLQYLTRRHAVQFLSLIVPSSPPLPFPQLAHTPAEASSTGMQSMMWSKTQTQATPRAPVFGRLPYYAGRCPQDKSRCDSRLKPHPPLPFVQPPPWTVG